MTVQRWTFRRKFRFLALVVLAVVSLLAVAVSGVQASSTTTSSPSDPPSDTMYFPETGHVAGHGFLAFWQHFGGVPVFGYPLTNEFHGCDPQGWCGTMQYFQRALFVRVQGAGAISI